MEIYYYNKSINKLKKTYDLSHYKIYYLLSQYKRAEQQQPPETLSLQSGKEDLVGKKTRWGTKKTQFGHLSFFWFQFGPSMKLQHILPHGWCANWITEIVFT